MSVATRAPGLPGQPGSLTITANSIFGTPCVGNGRATKEFLYQLAKRAGYELEFQRVGPKTCNTAAERQTSAHDARLSRDVFDKIATPSRAIAFRDEHILDAVKRFPELQGAADALEAAQRKSQAEYDASTARLFMAKVRRSCSTV